MKLQNAAETEPRDIDATSDLDQRANDVDAVCSRESSRTLNRTCLMCGGAPLHRDFGQRSVALAATGPEALHGRLQNGVVFLNFSGFRSALQAFCQTGHGRSVRLMILTCPHVLGSKGPEIRIATVALQAGVPPHRFLLRYLRSRSGPAEAARRHPRCSGPDCIFLSTARF